MDDVPRLSYREACVLRFLVEGASNKVIGRNIEVAEATVKVHVKAILRKIRARNRTQAAVWAMNNGSLARPFVRASKLDCGSREPRTPSWRIR
jgi:two-component system nitrate/nitrite response regulator NarL